MKQTVVVIAVEGITMRHTYVRLALMLVLILLTYGVATAEDKTLGEIRKELLGSEVVIFGSKFGLAATFMEWHSGNETSPGIYSIQTGNLAPYSLKGKRGTVVAIQLAQQLLRRSGGATKDVFGEAVAENDRVNPYCEVYVKMPDGVLIGTRNYYGNFIGPAGSLALGTRVDNERRELENVIPTLIGRTLYPIGYSVIFPSDVDIDSMASFITHKAAQLRGVPNLKPVKITKGAYVETEHAAVLKIDLGNGQSGIVFSQISFRYPANQPLGELVTSGFLSTIPKSLTSQEIDAIKRGSIFRGMSLKALHYSVGFPDKKNDWGRGGEQLLYGTQIMVYVRDERVVDWQSLSR